MFARAIKLLYISGIISWAQGENPDKHSRGGLDANNSARDIVAASTCTLPGIVAGCRPTKWGGPQRWRFRDSGRQEQHRRHGGEYQRR
jgi:hypothetical protein